MLRGCTFISRSDLFAFCRQISRRSAFTSSLLETQHECSIFIIARFYNCVCCKFTLSSRCIENPLPRRLSRAFEKTLPRALSTNRPIPRIPFQVPDSVQTRRGFKVRRYSPSVMQRFENPTVSRSSLDSTFKTTTSRFIESSAKFLFSETYVAMASYKFDAPSLSLSPFDLHFQQLPVRPRRSIKILRQEVITSFPCKGFELWVFHLCASAWTQIRLYWAAQPVVKTTAMQATLQQNKATRCQHSLHCKFGHQICRAVKVRPPTNHSKSRTSRLVL